MSLEFTGWYWLWLTRHADSPVIFGGITILGIATWVFTPKEAWLPAARLGKVHQLEENE